MPAAPTSPAAGPGSRAGWAHPQGGEGRLWGAGGAANRRVRPQCNAAASLGAVGMGLPCTLGLALALLGAAKGQTPKGQTQKTPVTAPPGLQSFQQDEVWGLGGRGRQPALC